MAERIQSIFDDVDVVDHAGHRDGSFADRGVPAARSDLDADVGSPRVPFQAMFNVTGQPAAVVPWDLDGNGVPTSIQLVGRPFDEATLLSLGAQIEQARPWAKSVLRCPSPSPRPTPDDLRSRVL